MSDSSNRAEELTIPYRASLARLCAGTAAAVLLCWLEEQFKNVAVTNYTVAEMCQILGMRKRQFLQGWFEIGVTHKYRSVYAIARITGREFWSPRLKRCSFYSAEVTSTGHRRIRRDGELIERELDRLLGDPMKAYDSFPNISAKALARADAARLIARLSQTERT